MHLPFPATQDILLIGGGHAHALVLRMWGMDPLAGARLTVVNPGPIAPYTGMLPGAIAGHYAKRDLMIDLVRLARFASARVILDRVVGLDPKARMARLSSGRLLPYDVASIDIGIASDLPEIAGYAEHGVSAKPLGAYADRWEKFVATAKPHPRVTVIGGGVGGVELALASAHRLKSAGLDGQVTVLEKEPVALPGIAAATRATLIAAMKSAGVTLRAGTTARRLSADWVELSDGSNLATDFTLSVAGARPQTWLAETGLELEDGFVRIGPSLQSSDPHVFAAGDCAHMAFAPRPKAGVFAVRQAPILFHNLRASVSGGRFRAYSPQRDYLKLVSMGGKTAVADKFGLRTGGAWLWDLKDRIDRKFMAKFEDYPQMAGPSVPRLHADGLIEAMGDKPMCGGCGAKVGPAALSSALSGLPATRREDVLSGPGDDAAVLHVGGARQVITTDHLRAFVNDPALMARLAAIHALGDVWAMGAEPQVALAQITLPRLSASLQERMLAEVMAAASEVIRAAGADIAGGHTTVGDELTIGFTVTGLGWLTVPKAGARPGDAVLLTKPLGTGVILAAEMALARLTDRNLLLGEAWAGCIASMERPLAPAASILRERATAMTDVTGFGLLGHLWEMLGKGAASARLTREAVPLLPGALDLASQGVGSTLLPANRSALDWHVDGPSGPLTDVLFDPQTCGGLLATVPPAFVSEMLESLSKAGQAAAVIGQITVPDRPGEGRITLI
ncbi:selenide, water dikinase SelD [Thioclava sp. FR2]|uniref:selenide, water dikinase SelD n=1 Tax=Thioclava sp. FR2 TaxID=3445780 RepID=UPI003EBC81EC